MDPEKKTTFGATIEQPTKPSTPPPANLSAAETPELHLKPSKETVNTQVTTSPHSFISTPTNDPGNPFSAFYEHRPSTADGRNLKLPNVYQHDVESQCQLSQTKSVQPTQDCTMWPSRVALKAQAKQDKAKRSWNPLVRLNKRQRLIAQILIALLIVGAAVGIGVGVSRAVGGGVWSGNGQTKQIPKGGNGTPDKHT
jgi:hypothetical protein